MDSDIIALCSKCGSTYGFSLKDLSSASRDKYEVGRINLIEERYY